NAMYLHLTLVPYIAASGELKTKPTQHSVRELMQIGIQPHALICRSEHPLNDEIRRKIALFTNVDFRGVIEALDVDCIYQVPLDYRRQGLDDYVLETLGLEAPPPDLSEWSRMVELFRNPPRGSVRIAVVGKYTNLVDSYKSVQQALIHGGIANEVGVRIDWLSAEELETRDVAAKLDAYDGLLIPGGFGPRGVEGMLRAIRWAREEGRPFFGICLGLQCAVIEFARNVCELDQSHSMEFAPDSPDPVICLMDSQRQVTDKGGTMRLGAYPAKLKAGSRVSEIYGAEEISERHRHRYEVNHGYLERLEGKGLGVSAVSPDRKLVEMIELADHPWFVGCQFHPELKSRPTRPHPLFASFIKAAARHAAVGREDARGAAVGVRG
ncbi:MAG: CTP synthase, partial [Gemmatimonadetes bacterium]|nr:CTP synthase [Gemmatimonadota bacterium]